MSMNKGQVADTKVVDARCRHRVASGILGWLPYEGEPVPLNEKLLIERIRRAAATRGQRAGQGIGDDCAVLPLPRGHEALVTTDFSLEDVHFRREWHPPDSVGHRCLARGLSDIAAMGGIPRAAFLSLALPAELPQSWVDKFIAGLLKLADAIFSSARGRRHGAVARRRPGRHRGARQRSGGTSHLALGRAAGRFPLRHRHARLGRRCAQPTSRREEIAAEVAPEALLSRAARRGRAVPAREEAGLRHDRHQRRTLHRPGPHLRREWRWRRRLRRSSACRRWQGWV